MTKKMLFIIINICCTVIASARPPYTLEEVAGYDEPSDVVHLKQMIATGKYNNNLNGALKHAAGWSSLEMVKTLVEAGADDLTGALFDASYGHKPNRFPIVKYLVEHGAEINKKDSYGATPLFYAAQKGDNVSLWLLKQGADPNISLNDNPYRNIMYEAASKMRTEFVRALIKKGVNANVKGNKGKTPLHLAASIGRAEMVSVLIEGGADINALNYRKFTPLHAVVNLGIEEPVKVVKLLLDAGADVTIKDKYGMTPFDIIRERLEKAKTKEYKTDAQRKAEKKQLQQMFRLLKKANKKQNRIKYKITANTTGTKSTEQIDKNTKEKLPATTVPDSKRSLPLKMILMIAAIICIAGITALIIKKHKK